jgi:hypothetical protein
VSNHVVITMVETKKEERGKRREAIDDWIYFRCCVSYCVQKSGMGRGLGSAHRAL